jgi:deoxyribose-phosphate aldolase
MLDKSKIVSLIDLTLLGDKDTQNDIVKLCSKAKNSLGVVAALCVYKKFIPIVKQQLGKNFKVATVVNFPAGDATIQQVLDETQEAFNLGADEIDLVIDYKEYIKKGSSEKSKELVSQVKKLCDDKILKVIIESGELRSDFLIKKVSQDVIDSGADFVKTSTGKVSEGATLQAAKVILETIKQSAKKVGFKASGGIRNSMQAVAYIQLADNILGSDFIDPKSFRFGVSGLLDDLLNKEQEEINGY